MPPFGRLPAVPAPPDDARRRFGRYYTPSPLVDAVHRHLAGALEEAGLDRERCSLVDPACGPGAFLAAPGAASYGARLGLDLDAAALGQAREAIPEAELTLGDAYGEGLEALRRRVQGSGALAVVGNPPYVANSELLRSGRYHAVRDALLPFAREVARGTSIRDDYALFFGVADQLIEAAGGGGAIAFVTSSSFVDNFLYAPMRRWLLSRYRLHALVELGAKLFEGTKVSTAFSVWVRDPAGHGERSFGHARLEGSVDSRLMTLAAGGPALAPARPHGPGLLLHAPSDAATRLLEAMRAAGDPIASLFPFNVPGLKTRFEELLVDDDRATLTARMAAFFEAPDPESFAQAHRLPEKTMPKLRAAFEARSQTRFDARAVRPFARYAGRPHRFRVPDEAMAWAYVDPALIPRGDHRFRGDYDPHVRGPKLVFNAREVPLTAAVVHGPTCVHDYRHARFAPLWAPQRAVEGESLRAATLGPDVLNLAPAWQEAARRFDEPEDLLYYVAAIVNSRLVQEQFAPVAGATEEVPVPRIDDANAKLARGLAAAARGLKPGSDLSERDEAAVCELYRATPH